MLVGRELLQLQAIALGERRQRLLVVFGRRLVLTFGVHADEAVELHDLARRAEDRVVRLDVDARLLEARRLHLAGNEAVPDERVEIQLVLLEEGRNALGVVLDAGRTNRLVRVLRALLRAIDVRLLGDIVGAEALRDVAADGIEGVVREPGRVGAHVGDETDRAFLAELDAFI